MASTTKLASKKRAPTGPLVEGRYRFVRELGRGAHGRVWLAIDQSQGGDDSGTVETRRAVKLVPKEHGQRLRWEWDVLSRVQHPTLTRALDLITVTQAMPELDVTVGSVLMVTELAPGEPLDRAMDPDRTSRSERIHTVLSTAFCVARALAAFHRVGLTHGDVKPSNILWHERQAMLIDPGLAGPPMSSSTINGTPSFLAPEAWRGERSYATDLFALGMTLLHALSSDTAHASTHETTTDSHVDLGHVLAEQLRNAWNAQERARSLPAHVPVALRNLIAELLDPSAQARPTATETAARVAAIAQALHVHLSLGEDEAKRVGGGADLDPTPTERVAHFRNLPAVGQQELLRDLRSRLSSGGVTHVIGARGSGRSRLIRDAVSAIQQVAVHGGGPVPSYLPVYALPDRLPTHDCVIHVHDGVRVTEMDAQALVASGEVDGARVHVVIEREGTSATRDQLFVPPLVRNEVAKLLHQAFGARDVAPALVDQAVRLSGGLAGGLCELLCTHCGDSGDPEGMHDATTRVGSAPAFTVPDTAHPLVRLLAAAGGTLDAVTAQTVLDDAGATADATQQLITRGLASLLDDGRLSLRADVTIAERRTLHANPGSAKWIKRALQVTSDPAARAALMHVQGDPKAFEVARLAVVSIRDAGQLHAATQLGLDLLRERDPGAEGHGLTLEVARGLLLLGRYRQVIELLTPISANAARLCLAEAERRSGHLDLARAALTPALAEDDEDADLHAAMARLELDAGHYAEAQRHADVAIRGVGWSRARGLEVAALHALRNVDHARAREQAGLGLEHARQHQLHAEVSRLLSVLATIDLAQGDTAAASAHYAQGLDLAERVGDVHSVALCLLNLGLARVDRAELGPGLSSLKDAARRLLRLGRTSDAARALYNLGNAASLIGDDDMAWSALRLAEKAAEDAHVPSALAYARLCQAEIAVRRGDAPSATQRLRDVAGLAELSIDEQEVIAARSAVAWQQLGEHAQAQAALARATALSTEERSTRSIAELSLARARVASAQGDVAAALSAAELALTACEQAGTFELRLRAALCMAQALEACDRTADGRRFLEVARRLLDQVAAGLSPSERARLRAVAAYRPGFVAAPLASTHATDASQGTTDDRWRKLATLSKQLVGEPRASRLMDRVLDAAITLVNAERGFVVEHIGGQLHVRASRGLTEATIKDAAAPSRTFVARVISEGRALASVDALQDSRLDTSASVHALSLRSVIAVPLRTEERIAGAIYLDDRLRPFAFGEEELALLSNLADIAALALDGAHRLRTQQRATRRMKGLRQRLRRTVEAQAIELSSLRHASDAPLDHPSIVGRGPAMRGLLAMVDRVARSDLPVLITGESGTGKELIAHTIHVHGPRKATAFVSENCAAIPETLLESALFGHVRGAFTGADRSRVGLFEAADGGTLFLDEIGEMSAAMQTRLLRVLQDGEIRPVGTDRARKVDVRVIAATHRDLEQMVKQGSFRQDLFYRLAVVSLSVPALRERPEDIAELVTHFARKHADPGRPARIDRKALALLTKHSWPGNVRQLENEIRRALVLADGTVHPEHLSAALSGDAPDPIDDLDLRAHTDALERRLIRSAMEQTHNNQTQAAKLLGVSRYGLQKMLKRLEIG